MLVTFRVRNVIYTIAWKLREEANCAPAHLISYYNLVSNSDVIATKQGPFKSQERAYSDEKFQYIDLPYRLINKLPSCRIK